MNTKLKQTLITFATTLSAILLVTTATYAIGSLTPSGTAGDDTQVSLNDIYGALDDFSNHTVASTTNPIAVPGSVSASFHTLSEIYALISAESSDLVPENIADGVEIFGVEGTLTAGAPALTWQTDPGITLCHSTGQYETDNGCSIGSGWTAEGYGAVEYCANLVTEGSSDWRLPTRAEFASITDDTTYNNATQVPGFAQNTYYWSSTLNAGDPDYLAWYWYSYDGYVNSNGKINSYAVRCVR